MKQNNRLIGCSATAIPFERLLKRSIAHQLSQGPKAGTGICSNFTKRIVQSAVKPTVSDAANRQVILLLLYAATKVVSAIVGMKPRRPTANANKRGAPRMHASALKLTKASILEERPNEPMMRSNATNARIPAIMRGKKPGPILDGVPTERRRNAV
jgi:hypothetical protein